jgi:transcriptional regulator with XRE-family HTH domain
MDPMPDPTSTTLGDRIARAIWATARAYGWSQRELAARLDTNQSAVRRLVRGGPLMDVAMAGAALDLLGIRVTIDADPIGLAARGEQRDAVHARCCSHVIGHLARRGWDVRSEVEIGEGRFRGWIDILAFRPAGRALLVVEVKTRIDDLGRTLRTLGWYVRSSREAAHLLGWRPRSIAPALLCLATDETDARLAAANDQLRIELPGRARHLATWIDDPAAVPARPSLALIDPRSRRRDWLIRTRADGRRSPAPSRDHRDLRDVRDAAAALGRP